MAQAHNTKINVFFYFYASAQQNVTCGIYYYITTEFDYVEDDSRLAAHGGAVLKQFELLKVCMGTQQFGWKKSIVFFFLLLCNSTCHTCTMYVSFCSVDTFLILVAK